MIGTKKLALAIVLFATSFTFAGGLSGKSNSIFLNLQESQFIANDIERVEEWTDYKEFGGIKIEYKFQDCHSEDVTMFRNLTLVFFRFTNTTNQKLELFWSTEISMDGECVNCDKTDREDHKFSLKLDAQQVIEGNCYSKNNRALYIAANFIKLSPGMSGTRLTNFNFINLKTSVWK